ncbi:FGGY-family carbohydrate kinase [Chakrabartyella piscis]|uniref:FGGY-family carbohydrate kinase n=1 Tax=Chakrabartyella piscis TaxID=2918914 RepID=UPI0029585ABC|nr:FGGY-family carbohydrate kinase [Chakrabartyella piscis]
MKEYLVAIDAGNTSCKVVIFDTAGNVVATAVSPVTRVKKRGIGFEEFDIADVWNFVSKAILEAIESADIDASGIKGIGVTSFGNGCVILGENGKIIAPGCLSQDYRATGVVEAFEASGAMKEIVKLTKAEPFAGSPIPILRWYKDNEKDVYDQIACVLTFKDYIMYQFTGVFATDLNCIGGSVLLDMDTMDYSQELLDICGIPELYDAMPKLAAEATEVVGVVTEEASKMTGIPVGTPVVAGVMDVLAGLVAAGATEEGAYTLITGSWCINQTHSEEAVEGIFLNMPYLKRGRYLNCSNTGASGSNYEWFTQVLGDYPKIEAEKRGITMYQVLNELIASVNPADAKVLFCPYVAQPGIVPGAQAAFVDINQDTSYAELAYAVAEGVGFIHRHHVEILKAKGLPLNEIRLIGGTAKSTVWNQIFANILQVPIIRVDCDEACALGSAIVAGIGVGVYDSYEDAFAKAVKIKEPMVSNPEMVEIYNQRYELWCDLNKAMEQFWSKRK